MKTALRDKSVTWFVVFTSAATLLVVFIVAMNAFPLGAPNVWTWQYHPLADVSRVFFGFVPITLATVVLLGARKGILDSTQPTRSCESATLISLCLGAFVSANAVLLMHPLGWAYPATLVVNPAANSYFTTALHNPDLPALLSEYPRKMSAFVSHAQTQSAGPVVLSSVVIRIADASPLTPVIADTLLALTPGTNAEELAQNCRQWESDITASQIRAALCVALFMVAVGSLAVIPIYFLGKWLDSPGTGLFAALGFVLLPAFVLFAPSVDQMYPLVTAASLCLVWLGLSQLEIQPSWRALLWFGLAGLWLGAGLVFNLGLVVAVALCGLFAVLAGWAKRLSAKWLAMGAAVFSLGVALTPLLLYLVSGYDLWAVFVTSNHLRDTLYYGTRSFVSSLWANPIDFFLFCGLPVFLLWLWDFCKTIRIEPRSAKAALLAAFVFTLLLIDISGRTRGEVARMWMFLTPPLLIGTGAMLTVIWRTSRPAAVLLLTLQATQIIVFQYFVRVWGY